MKKSLRFKIFERDNFTCQYCGRKTPDVILHLDHIYPKSKGGKDDEINLITSCVDCNLGKSNKIIKNPRTKKQNELILEELKEKNEQLKKYYKFLRVKEIKDNEIINNICFHWERMWKFKYELSIKGKTTIRKFLTFLTPQEIKESMDIAFCKIPDRIEDCFKYFCGVVYTKKRNKL